MESSHSSNLSDWMQGSLLVQTPFGKSPVLEQYQRLPDDIEDVKSLGTST